MNAYAVVFEKQMLVTTQVDGNAAIQFAIKHNGDQWKYATVTELDLIEVHDYTGKQVYKANYNWD